MIKGCIVPILLFVIALCLYHISCTRMVITCKVNKNYDEIELQVKKMKSYYDQVEKEYKGITNTLNQCNETIKRTSSMLTNIQDIIKKSEKK